MTTGQANEAPRQGLSLRRVAEDTLALGAGIAAGAGLMYLCDPGQGRGRRNRIAQAAGLRREDHTLAGRGMILLNRARGFASEAVSGIAAGKGASLPPGEPAPRSRAAFAPGLLISVAAGLALFNKAKPMR